MADTKLRREDEIDQRFDDKLNSRVDSSELAKAEDSTGQDAALNAGIDQAEAFANDPANATKNRENQFDYSPSTSPESRQEPKQKFVGKMVKKYGASGGIIGLLFGGVFGFGVLFSPALAIVHLKEILVGDLNDQVAALDVGSTKVFRAKLKDLGKSTTTCTLIKVRCGLAGMSDRQIKNFEKAGIKVNTADGGKNPVTRKSSIKSLEFTDSSGKTQTLSSVRDLDKFMIDSSVKSQLRRAYNPNFYGLWDKTAGKVLGKFKTNRADKLKGNSKEEFNKSVDDSVNGRAGDVNPRASAVTDDPNDPQNAERERQNSTAAELADKVKTSGGFKSVFGSAVKGVGALGAVDSACTVRNVGLAVEAGAKVIRAAQLVGYAMVFLNLADSIKLGTATPEQVEYAGNILTAVDDQKKVIDETSPLNNGVPQEVNNPNYGKNAFDSQGMKAAQYNDAPVYDARAQQYMAGGAMVGTLAGINNKITSLLGGKKNARTACKFVQNPIVRGGSLVIGGFAAIGSFGVTTAISIAGSLAFSAALPLLTGYLKDMIAGKTVDASTSGVDSGNAIFGGAGVLLGNMAMAHGLQPANTSQIKQYAVTQTAITNEYIAAGVEDAKSTPFDITNQYSFLGIAARKVFPVTSSSNNITSLFSSVGSLISHSLMPLSFAADSGVNPARFSTCNDEGYDLLGISADVSCNVRYVSTPVELAQDPDDNYQWMFDHGYIDDTGAITTTDQGTAYSDWKKECVDRASGWGEYDEEEGSAIGQDCIDSLATDSTNRPADTDFTGKFNLETLKNFRNYVRYSSIEEGMDNGPTTADASSADSGTAAPAGTVTWPVDKKWWDANNTDFLNQHTTISGTFTGSYDKGLADDISSVPKGTPVLAMVGGKVIKTNLCGAGDGMIIESQIQGGVLDIAYGHGTSPLYTIGQSVEAGKQILSLDGVGCKTTGPHLHLDMTFNGKRICPQGVFTALGAGQTPNFEDLTTKVVAQCSTL